MCYDLMEGLGAFLRRQVPKSLFGPPGLDGCLGVPYREFVASLKGKRRVAALRPKQTTGKVAGSGLLAIGPLKQLFLSGD